MDIKNRSSISDAPIIDKEGNRLGIESYVDALTQFIENSSTPMTIGVQGEWGTGKTSIMNLIKGEIESKSTPTAWVNVWEYSLFNDQSQVTFSVLQGLLESLILNCKERGIWNGEKEFTKKLGAGLKRFGAFVVKAAVNQTTGQDIEVNVDSDDDLRSQVALMKQEIGRIVDLILEESESEVDKLVFFIDDLDRIDPSLAVEILESLKNTFDLKHCVFILAIDYEVVVKGLTKKFGPKTTENEREFRSFFDKLIQVPFSMPVQAYEVDKLIEDKLQELGLMIDEYEGVELKDYVDIVKKTTGYNPRSIKRYINTFSLIKSIKLSGDVEDEPIQNFCLFSLIGIQIEYPQVFRLMAINPLFNMWDETDQAQFDLPDELVEPKNSKKDDRLDEKWELILWNYCQKSAFLRTRVFKIIEALNSIREIVGKEELKETIIESMKFAAITSVDDEPRGKSFDNLGRGEELNSWDEYLIYARDHKGFPENILNLLQEAHEKLGTNAKVSYIPSGVKIKLSDMNCKLVPQKGALKIIYQNEGSLTEDSVQKSKDKYVVKIGADNDLQEFINALNN